MKAILVKAGKSDVSEAVTVVDIKPELDNYYKLLECSTIDMKAIRLGDRHYDIICDDEGLFVNPDELYVTYTNLTQSDSVAGNILLVGPPDEEGCETSLTDDDIVNIHRHIGLSVQHGQRTILILNK